MSRSTRPEKRRRRPKNKPESSEIGDSVSKRHTFGRSEKIRRRNRKIWTRLANKQRRKIDKKELIEE